MQLLASEIGSGTATLYFVGDAMQHGKQLEAARTLGNGNYDYSDCFILLEPTIKAADYAVVNLEVPLGGPKGGYTGYPKFSAPDSYAVALKDAGFDMLLTANNHILDRSDNGLRRTLAVLDTLGVDFTGTYYDRNQRLEKSPVIKDINGIKFGFVNYTYGTNGIKAKKGAEVAYIKEPDMKREIEKAKELGAEMIVVCIHWGEEYEMMPNAAQKKTAQFLLDQGADLIIGSHPHVVQPMYVVDNPATGRKALIAYSLGNFISNQTGENSRGGASVLCTVERDENGVPQLIDAEYDTFFTAKPYNSTTNYQVVPASMADRIPENQKAEWNKFHNNSESLFTKENIGVKRASEK